MTHKLSAFSIILVSVSTIAVFAIGACQSDPLDEQDELQALLRDRPLSPVIPGAAVASAAGDGGAPQRSGLSHLVSAANPIGAWNFDDCTPSRTNLADATFNGNTAFRSVGVACTAGIQGGPGVAIANPEDIVYVPDQPSFTLGGGVTVAGWFNPTTTGGIRTLLRKRDKGTSSFALVLNGGKFQFVAGLADGRAISVIAPKKATLGAFQHVAGSYDNTTLRLYVDGLEVASLATAGTIAPGPGPLLMGNDGSERRFAGAIDSTLFATHALTADEVLALSCVPQRPTMVMTPADLSSPAGVPATIDLALTNHSPASCAPIAFSFVNFSTDNRLTFDPPPFTLVQSAPVPSGTTGHFTFTAATGALTEPGTTFRFSFEVLELTTGFDDERFTDFTVSAPNGCHVIASRELMLKNISVVEDPVRAMFDPSSSDPRNGVWTFKHLAETMAPTPGDAPAMVEAMLDSFTSPGTINGFTVDARPVMQSAVLDPWPRTADGALDLARAPLRLQAIVNRFDLRDLASGNAGEGRFVFAFYDPTGFPMQATLIFEYRLPAATDQDVLGWAQSFHALSALPFGEDYNAALQAITERFVGRGARPDHPNGSAISAVRSNEISFSNSFWQMRTFRLSPSSGLLEPAPLDLTPDRGFNQSPTLASYINANQAAIIAESHTVPAMFDGQPFQAGAVANDLGTWFAPGVDSEARHHFALDTCNGCHSVSETHTFFLQISPRFASSEASLSGFLTGTTVSDPVTGQPRTFNDLSRRNVDLTAIVCADPMARSGALQAKLRRGIQRVH